MAPFFLGYHARQNQSTLIRHSAAQSQTLLKEVRIIIIIRFSLAPLNQFSAAKPLKSYIFRFVPPP